MMGRIAYLCVGLAALVSLPTEGRSAALPHKDQAEQIEQIRTFAYCAGRMMALRDHLSIFGTEGVDAADTRRSAHLAILDALVEIASEDGFDYRQAYSWQIDARAAQTAVLSQADFGTSETTRRRARAAADRHIASCDRLILGA